MSRKTYFSIASLIIFASILILWPDWGAIINNNQDKNNIYNLPQNSEERMQVSTTSAEIQNNFYDQNEQISVISTGSADILVPRDLQ